MKIYKVEEMTQRVVVAFERLMPQLAEDLKAPSEAYLEKMIAREDVNLFLAELDDEIVGAVTLIINEMPSGRKGRIEDVIVDSAARGRGVARQMMDTVIDFAKAEGLEKIDLTSNPIRVAAHKLYDACGFVKRDTAVFRLEIKN